MHETPQDPADDNGPAAEVLPTLHAAHKLLVDGLKACGHPDAIFAVVMLMPKASDNEGMDVIRVAANMPPDEIGGFLQHVARVDEPPTDPNVKVLSIPQALRLLKMLGDPDKIVAELKKRGVH